MPAVQAPTDDGVGAVKSFKDNESLRAYYRAPPGREEFYTLLARQSVINNNVVAAIADLIEGKQSSAIQHLKSALETMGQFNDDLPHIQDEHDQT